MTDSVEDRIHRAGKHDQFTAALEKFQSGPDTPESEQELYDELIACGMSPEEADAWVEMEVGGDDGE